MRVNRNWAGLAIATAAGVLLIVGRSDLETLLARDTVSLAEMVDDRAGVLDSAERERIADYHAALRRAHDIDYRVAAISASADLERTAHDYFEKTGVGSASVNGRGLLLVIDTAGERVRLEVSTSLEGVYTDAFIAYGENRQMTPFFAAGRVADGILATTELIVGRAQDASAGAAFAPAMTARSMGGGASAAAAIGTATGPSREFERQTQHVDADRLDPLQVVEAYHERMAQRDARTDLPLYTSDTVAMLREWIVTPAQMDNVARTYRGCAVDGVLISGGIAVVRYRVEQRQCAPYFLRREGDAWKLDLAALSAVIRFNHENQWRFQTTPPDDYGFAFENWRIDRDGFPHRR
jgi:uncharacterized protein